MASIVSGTIAILIIFLPWIILFYKHWAMIEKRRKHFKMLLTLTIPTFLLVASMLIFNPYSGGRFNLSAFKIMGPIFFVIVLFIIASSLYAWSTLKKNKVN